MKIPPCIFHWMLCICWAQVYTTSVRETRWSCCHGNQSHVDELWPVNVISLKWIPRSKHVETICCSPAITDVGSISIYCGHVITTWKHTSCLYCRGCLPKNYIFYQRFSYRTERSISVKHVGIVFGKHGGWLQVSFGSRWLNVQMAFGFWHSTTKPC